MENPPSQPERGRSTISFTRGPFLRQLSPVGRLLAARLFLAALPHAYGQDQEHQLLNRLPKPDMSLQNAAQNKKFIAVKGTSLDKHPATGTFYLEEKSNSKRFSGPRD